MSLETAGESKASPSCLVIDSQKQQKLKTVYKFGERGSGTSVRGKVQDFFQLRDYHLGSGTLFEDPQFPADDSSIYYSSKPPSRFVDIVWKRPHELCDDPKLFMDSFSRFDVTQGNCCLAAAIANLSVRPHLILQIVPNDQSFNEEYAGIFHFRFWQFGKWIDVVIDDRLPTRDGELVFLRSPEPNEFWSALFEKAYAKLNGFYETLESGTLCEFMENFTGGVSENYTTAEAPRNLFKMIKNASDRGSLIGLGIKGDHDLPEGLVKNHCYSCTEVLDITISTAGGPLKFELLKIRNPWGNDIEWKGPWSDKSSEWVLIPDHEKRRIELTFDTEGEFWMSFQDVLRHFSAFEICHLNPESLEEEVPKKWEFSMYEGSWVKGVTAGGCRNYIETFASNPQYNITLSKSDEDDACIVIVSLTQKNRRKKRNVGIKFLTIGFVLYYIPNPDRAPKPLNRYFFEHNKIVAKSRSINAHGVSCRLELPPGTYCIIPSAHEPNQTGDFLLRVFSESKNYLEENDQLVDIIPKVKEEENISTDSPLYKLFNEYAEGQEEIGWMELQNIWNSTVKNGSRRFSSDVCKTLVALLDENNSGKLGFDEFVNLWEELNHWTEAFHKFDKDNSQTLNGCELREAINTAGFTVNARTLNMIMHRYGNKNVCLNFDDFIMCAIKLKNMIEKFRDKDYEGRNEASFSFEEFIDFS